MICPKCSNQLNELIKHNVVIGFCSYCSGLWFDREELGKIINQIKQAEILTDEVHTPFWKGKYGYYDRHKQKKDITFKKIFDFFD